jgi:hypothetical protein
MGGGGSTPANVTHVSTIIKTSVTNVVQKLYMEKSIAVKQLAQGTQTIENIRFTPPRAEFCPADQMKSKAVIRQASRGEQEVAITLDKLNAAELANAIRIDLERILLNNNQPQTNVSSSNNPNANTHNHFNATTVKNIQNTVEAVLRTYINQEQQWGQTIRMINIQQCGDVEITQDIQAKMLATDMAKAISNLAERIVPQMTSIPTTDNNEDPTPNEDEPQTNGFLSNVPIVVWIVLGILAFLVVLVLLRLLIRR